MITADLLARISLFAQLPESERASLAARAADVRVRTGDFLILEGQAPAFFGLLEGKLDLSKRIRGVDQRIRSYEPGDFFGEVPLLLGTSSLASLRATEPSRLLRLDRDDFLEMVSKCQVLSGEISRTMVERVRGLQQRTIEAPTAMATVIGHGTDPACYDLREFLSRNRIPFTWREETNGSSGEFPRPAVILPNGRRLDAPSFREVAEALELQTAPALEAYDVAIVGGGPAGLAAAVYGASEGLRTLLVSGRRGEGRQAPRRGSRTTSASLRAWPGTS